MCKMICTLALHQLHYVPLLNLSPGNIANVGEKAQEGQMHLKCAFSDNVGMAFAKCKTSLSRTSENSTGSCTV